MPANAKEMLKVFRGKRIVALLVVVGITAFLVLGGHRKVLSFAVDEMAGFLLDAGDLTEQELAEDGGMNEYAATSVPAPSSVLSGRAILSQVGAMEAIAAPAEQEARTADQPLLAQADPDPSEAEEESAESSVPARQRVSAYTASFLRDPFLSLVSKERGQPGKLLDVSSAAMVGSVWGESGVIALLEDDAGRSFALKVGDRVVNGRVVSVTPASVTFSITVFGLTRSVTLELAEEGEW